MDRLLSPEYGTRANKRSGVGDADQMDRDGFVVASRISPPPSREEAFNYIKNVFLSGKLLGLPVAPETSELTSEQLAEMGYRGVYEPETPLTRFSAPGCGTGAAGSLALYPKVA